MSGLGWALVGSGGLAVGLALACAALALRISGLKGDLATAGERRIKETQRADELAIQLGATVQELAEVRARTARQIADLRRDANACMDAHLAGASDQELRDLLRKITTPGGT